MEKGRPSHADSVKGTFVSLVIPALGAQRRSINVEQTHGNRIPLHLGPSSRLGLSIHPVQLLQALAQDVLDVFHQLLHLQGQGSGLKDQPRGDGSWAPSTWYEGSPNHSAPLSKFMAGTEHQGVTLEVGIQALHLRQKAPRLEGGKLPQQ